MQHLKDWFIATRPWSFSMTAISVSVGSVLAASAGPFSWPLYLLTLVGAVAMHAGTNLINDYYDVRFGLDTPEAATTHYRPHPIVHDLIPARQVLFAAYSLFGLAAAIGLYLLLTIGWVVAVIGLIGLLAGIGYTSPPLKYKYLALGELSVFLMWGPLMVEGAYYVQRHGLSFDAFLISLPFGVLVALVIFANNIRDIEQDRLSHVKTVAILLGQRTAMHAYLLLMALAYIVTLLITAVGVLTPWGLLVLLSLPLAARLFRQMRSSVPADADAMTAKLDTAFGTLLVIGLVVQNFLQ